MFSVSRHFITRVKPASVRGSLLNQKISKAASTFSYDDRPEDFLHRSILPMDHFQKSLPRLPIPELSKTCERYLTSQRVLLNDAEIRNTEKIVSTFQDGVGKALHEELVAKDNANKHTSYISAPWYDMYLKDRQSVVFNHNPFMSLRNDSKAEYNDQLIRASNMVISSMKFMKTLRANILDPEVYHLNPAKSDTESFRKMVRWLPKSVSWYGAYLMKAFPLDMSQFPWLFNGNRIPRPEKDEIYNDPTAYNLIVLRRGHIYSFNVLDANGYIISPEEMLANLKYILEDPEPECDLPLGILTTEDRDTWSNLRTHLEQSGNMAQLRKIDGAVFALCLDDNKPEDPRKMARQFLFGNGHNRWFDKCFSLIIAGNGNMCVNFEHSWGDGVAVMRYMNELYKDTITQPRVHPSTKPAKVDASQSVEKLAFRLDDAVKEGIRTAQAKYQKKSDSLELNYTKFKGWGKNYIKKNKLSPDSFMQLAIQLAYKRQYGETVATYESCSTSAFLHGRTETVRPATMATKKTCEMFDQAGTRPSVTELQAAMAECSKVHGQLTKEAAMGKGFDRHLFALKYLAAQNGSLPDMFQDPAYIRINHNILSTSTLSSPAIVAGGFGAVVPDGYGCGYAVDDDELGYVVTAYPPARDVNGFLDCIKSSLNDMKSILDGKDFK